MKRYHEAESAGAESADDRGRISKWHVIGFAAFYAAGMAVVGDFEVPLLFLAVAMVTGLCLFALGELAGPADRAGEPRAPAARTVPPSPHPPDPSPAEGIVEIDSANVEESAFEDIREGGQIAATA